MRRLALILLAVAALAATSGPRRASADEYLADVQLCLQNWKTHPFSQKPSYRVIEPQVKVFGLGGNSIDEKTATDKPELVYIRPNVSVMSKTVLNLLNPNGWYCLASNTAVMAKIEINLDCRAHLASAKEGVTVLGGGNKGVNVLGATTVNLIGCP